MVLALDGGIDFAYICASDKCKRGRSFCLLYIYNIISRIFFSPMSAMFFDMMSGNKKKSLGF